MKTACALFSAGAILLLARPTRAMEHRHALGTGYHFGHITAKEGRSFRFRNLPISYYGRYGGDWAATLRASLLFPLRASDGEVQFAPRSEYDQTQMVDWLLGASRRYRGLMGWDVDAGLGAHFHFARLRSTTYVEWSTAALGLGLVGAARKSLGAGLGGGYPELGLHFDLNYDFIDLSRGGDLVGGVQGQLGVSIGWTLGDKKK